MKKYFVFLIVLLFFSACGTPPTDVHEDRVYHEVETNISFDRTKSVYAPQGPTLLEQIETEVQRLRSSGENLWYEPGKEISIREKMIEIDPKLQCGDDAVRCDMDGNRLLKTNFPKEFQVGDCDSEDFCTILDPELPQNVVSKLYQNIEMFAFGKDIYTVGGVSDADSQGGLNIQPTKFGLQSVYRNQTELFSHKMFYLTNGVIAEAGMVLNSPFFTFFELQMSGWDGYPGARLNLWYQGETMNEKYGLDASDELFSFQNKLGFIGYKNEKSALYFDGKKISNEFSLPKFSRQSTDFSAIYRVSVDENGILFFVGERSGKYFFVEIDLNTYLN